MGNYAAGGIGTQHMQAWKKKKSLMRGVKFTAVFEPMEREVLGDLTSTVSEAIIARAQSAPKDELADMLDMPTAVSYTHLTLPTKRIV